jgi:hypothetical protein
VDTRIYAARLAEQGGHCALCENVAGKKSLHVDHDHQCCGEDKKFTCGKCNRGILCQVCNTRIGYLEQTIRDFPFERREDAEVYLRNSVLPDSWTHRALQYLKSYAAPDAQVIKMNRRIAETQEKTQQ